MHLLHRFRSTRVAVPSRALPLALMLALLAGCGSTPLPPWPAKAPLPPVERGHVTPTAPLATQPAPPAQPAIALPVPATWPAQAPSATLQVPTPGEPSAVTAHFPDPMVRYRTPGLADGRRAFTTNAELADWLGVIASAQQGAGTRTELLHLGPSQQGEPILGLVITRANGTTPDALEASHRPTVLLLAQQHGDEPAGAEALLVLAQELAGGLLEPLLDRINVVLVPRANPDGAETGTSATASGVDMAKDHLTLSTPEARAIATLTRDYRPILVLDAREFQAAGALTEQFGAVQSDDALLQYATAANVPEFLSKAAREWYYEPMAASLNTERLRNDWYFEPVAGAGRDRVAGGSVLPESVRNASGLKDAVGFVVASRGVGLGREHIQRRVHTLVTAISSALRSTAERSSNLDQVRSFVARDTRALACHGQVVVQAVPTPAQRDIELLDAQSGVERTEHVSWDSPLKLRTTTARPRPCGYWLAARADNVVDRLKLLGVQVMRVAEPGSILADSYDQTGTSATGQAPQVQLRRNAIDVPVGSYYVPLNQPLANLAVAALEPDSPAGYIARQVIEDVSEVARIVSTPSLVFEESN
ncbi:peptidase M14 [Simplicispira hankyongi]|uniref:Peptidase M14 n=1 Tax=Simplicispira hankyongi TaxID=2315688 RepID=A0A398CK15_9BURK|nr:peptidase M14 [Simplicispira hankyongi]